MLKANLEYLKGNYRKSLKLLQTSYNSSVPNKKKDDVGNATVKTEGEELSQKKGGKVPDIEPLVLNNMGCIQHSMQNYNAALWYLSRALKTSDSISLARMTSGDGKGQVPIATFSTDRRSHILFNTGMQLLFSGKPIIAFQCFNEASQLFYDHPRLWLRMAECCVAKHLLTEREKAEASSGDPLVTGSVGRGRRRKILLPVTTGAECLI